MFICVICVVGGVRVFDMQTITPIYKPDFVVSGYAIKVFAIIFSNFEEVLSLDADSLPVVNPDLLFELPCYQQFGNVFWSDMNGNTLDAVVYEMFNLTVPWEGDALASFFGAESGQVLLNRYADAFAYETMTDVAEHANVHRQRHVQVLLWMWFVTTNNDWFYQHMLGDKDSYRLAFALAGKP